ncbi:MAG: hypothetical protein AABX11_03085 [Nanoarchaeota archaeon]
MARPGDFVDPDYDRKLAEFKERRAQMKKEVTEQKSEFKPRRIN